MVGWLQLLLVLLAAAGNICLGLFTFLKNPRSKTSSLFLSFAIALSVYILANHLALTQTNDAETFFWLKVVIADAFIINLVFFLLVTAFPNVRLSLSKKILIPSWIVTILLVPTAALGLVFKGVIPSTAQPIPGPALPLFLAHTMLFLGGAIFTLGQKLKKVKGTEKAQIKLFLMGAVVMFTSIIVTNVFFVIFLKTVAFVSLLPVYTFIFVGSITYAIIKHRFLDIRLVVARTVSFSLLTLFIGFLYALIFGALSSLFTESKLDFRTTVVPTILALLMAFSFQQIRRFLEKGTDKILYRDKYDQNKLLSSLSYIMSTTIGVNDLTSRIIDYLLQTIKISRGAFILLDKEVIYEVIQNNAPQLRGMNYQSLIPLLKEDNALDFDQLPEGSLKNLMRSWNIVVTKVLKVKGEVIGILILGEKLSGEVYSEQDINLIDILAPEVAVAVQNSQSYDKIKKFNITLTQEVDKATSELRLANRKLEDLDHLKDDFVSVASHELRTPMTAIRSYAWMALNRPDVPLSDKLRRYLDRIFISTERLINLVNDMLNISRIESGRVEITPQIFDIKNLIEEVLSEIGPRAAEKKLNIRIYNAQVPKVFADPDKVHQVLLNLLGNSMKFTPEGGEITVTLFTDGQTVEVSVKDTGVGISADDLSRLFQKFGRLDNSYTAAATSGGTGLGLYISRKLIELMKGKIWAKSDGVGRGSTFTFSLPAATGAVLANKDKYSFKVASGEQPKYLEPIAI